MLLIRQSHCLTIVPMLAVALGFCPRAKQEESLGWADMEAPCLSRNCHSALTGTFWMGWVWDSGARTMGGRDLAFLSRAIGIGFPFRSVQ